MLWPLLRYIYEILVKKPDVFVIVYLDHILIYTKNWVRGHLKAFGWGLDQLRKNSLLANIKKNRFHKDEICFIDYIVLDKEVQIEDKIIDAIKNGPKLKSREDI